MIKRLAFPNAVPGLEGLSQPRLFLLAAGFIQHRLHAKALCVPRLCHLTLYRRSCPALHTGRVTVERDKCGHLCCRGEAGRHPETVKGTRRPGAHQWIT